MVSLNNLVYEQSKYMEEKNQAAQKLLYYPAMHPNEVIQYHTSKMWLTVHSDTLFLFIPKSLSRLGGHFILRNDKNVKNTIMHNGTILKIVGFLKRAMALSVVAKICGIFSNAQISAILRTTLE